MDPLIFSLSELKNKGQDSSREIKNKYPNIIVAIDGGVDFENLQSLTDAGADRFVSGHAIFQGELEPNDSVKKFRDILRA